MIKVEIVTKNGIWKKNQTEKVERRQKETERERAKGRGGEEVKNPNKNKCSNAVCADARVCVCG